MATEALYVPEDQLDEVILVIRNGLKTTKGLSRDTRRALKQWCDEEEEYLSRMNEE